MSEKKFSSSERNTKCAIFGTEAKERKDLLETPGPLDYDTLNKRLIGD
jgi:hypothetical protein